MSLDASARLSLLSRAFVSLGVVSAVSITTALVAAAATGFGVLFGIAAVVGVGTLFLQPFVGWSPLAAMWRLSIPEVVAAATLIGAVALPAVYLRPIRDEIRAFEAKLGGEGQLATERHPEVATTVRRLAQQADVPEPEVRIVNRRRPESYALGGRSGGTIVVTRGLVRALADDELEAVLAHEVSHLANGDGRIMRSLLVPMLLAERVGSDEPPKLRSVHGLVAFTYGFRLLVWAALAVVTTCQLALCQLGVALLSRGREWTADRGSAALTESPGALASALETLHDSRGRPREDLREFERTAGALDILPPEDRRPLASPFRTHPRTETRIERLESMAAERHG